MTSHQELTLRVEYVLHQLHGYGMAPRRPLLILKSDEGEKLMREFEDMLRIEKEYMELENQPQCS